ncbi:hypothetical protein TBR22_A06490 [Luteitalea sp. TBR-22]|uniref:hypothetical protein n=1 Tax=Luteitalea sp. TBR-22 TaxID=2802971 RepID=UPI001AF1CA39|nr:hypothetical protein [Luteitalea sp. TBR-22]BCS31448.1 hypothetical protein TBR22_A06490 [Luteitalea sp. TBR-22]
MANKESRETPGTANPAQAGASSPEQALPYGDLARLIRELAQQGGFPVALSATRLPPVDTGARLRQRLRRSIVFPPCADTLLGLVRTADTDEVTADFKDYFTFARHVTFGQFTNAAGAPEDLTTQLGTTLDPTLASCGQAGPFSTQSHGGASWPSDCCVCTPCVTLDGIRNTDGTRPGIRRLFIGDLVWLFYMERLGLFQILGAILDAFAYSGRLPISNGALDADGVADDVTALILEVMVRETRSGQSSTVRDRLAAYRTCLAWTTEGGRKLDLDTQVNGAFTTLFHKFIYHALEFYKDRRLAVAIQGTAAGSTPPSAATLITLSDTIEVLKNRFEAFDYGRNAVNALGGLVWAISAMTIIRALRTTIGIPEAFNQPHEYIPAAYDILVLKRAVTHGDANRYLIHRECARSGRDILLDMEVVDHTSRSAGGELERWITQIESRVEAYRTAYRNMTGVDIGASATPAIEQQA